MNIKSLSHRIIIVVSSIILVIVGILVIYFASTNRKSTVFEAKEQLVTKTEYLSLEIESLINSAFGVLGNENENILMLQEQGLLDKQVAMNLLETNLKRNKNFTGMCLIFEPNTLCKDDVSYPELMDRDFFIPYLYNNADGTVGYEPLVDWDVPGEGDYYLIPKQTKKQLLTEPYVYPVNGVNVYMITLVDVLMQDGEFLGISTADYDVNFMEKFANKIKNETYEGQLEISIISNEGAIVVNTVDSTIIGKNISEFFDDEVVVDDVLKSIKNGEDEVKTEDGYIVVNKAVKFGNTDNYWRVQIAIPEAYVLSSVKKQTFTIVIIGFVLLLISIVIVFFVVGKFISPIRKLSDISKELSNGNFNVEFEVKGNDEVAVLSQSFKNMINKFSEIILNIQEISTAVFNASNQLSIGSTNLSENANEQAATTEEISSSMEEILATVQSNTDKSENTNEISSNAAKKMQQNKDMILQTLESVNKISEKTSIISEIADKTDILSINAAIEAARAGDAGKGFAVVAQEIRKLADTTQIAAKEIGELSKTNQNISQISSKQLEKVIPEIIRSAELVNDIVVGSKEQQSSIESINNAIFQLTESTNENSASAEEMSASAEELSAQAEQLKELISVFKIEK